MERNRCLANTAHTVRVEWTGVAGGTGGWDRINIDALDVTGVLVQTP